MIYRKTHTDKKALSSHVSKIKKEGGYIITEGLSIKYFYPSNTINQVKEKHKSWKKTNQQKVLFIVAVAKKDGTIPYFDVVYFPKWVDIGGIYGERNELTVIEKF